MSRRDAAGRLVASVAHLLPPGRREWGAAMQAELEAIGPRGERWRFAAGCVRVVVTRPAVWRRTGYPLLVLALLVAGVHTVAGVSYGPLRWGLVGLVGALLLVVGLGRVRPFGPVAGGAAARGLRTGGHLLVGALAAEAVASMAHKTNHDIAGVPVYTVMFAGYLLGLAALTARRSPATTRTLIIGVAAGGVAAAGWTVLVMAFPPIPADPSAAVLFTVAGMGAAGWVAARRGGGAAELLAGACAGTVATLLILNVFSVLVAAGPAWLITPLVPHALTPADRLAGSRIEIHDPYLWMLLFGWLIAVGLCAAVVRRSAVDGVSADHAGPVPGID
ncbi:hypothetical protein HH310_22725 [Actinoplanes sp. TBRC 11911]|uniref:hypothetical protein n=1 Tax=Actinoplanes sp. TBRC 11911 TaxID=2729386 RepID=UPI00145E1308|nr:hypothetical protein [Actinoplanes sp. TBRC 11911]NMO53983.1 hypothetical protein [Actinoplanes sp. TBRC 11911]